ncbi:MAG: hypothetical protein LUG66_10745 [Clostridiales bacterium]|nr:hypothetical protein [Clostridiales bacterium]
MNEKDNKKEETKANDSLINENEEITPADFKFDLKSPEDEEDKIITKGNRLKIAIYALCFIAAAVVISVFAYNYALKSPKSTIIKAYSNTLEEFLAADSSVIDTEALKTFLTTVPTETDLKLTYKSSDKIDGSMPVKLTGSGLEAEVLYDPVNKETGGSVSLTFASMPIEAAKFYADETTLKGKVSLLEEEWVNMPLNNIFSAYNASALSDHLGDFEYADDFSLNLFSLPEILGSASVSKLMREYLSSEREVFAALKENMSAAKSSQAYTLENGKTAQGYNVILKGSDLKDLFNDIADFGEGNTDYLPVIKTFLPVIKVMTGNYNTTADELSENLTSSAYEALHTFADSLTEDYYTLTVFVYKKKIAGAEWSLPLSVISEDKSCSLTLYCPTGSISEKQSLSVDVSDFLSLSLNSEDNLNEKTLSLESGFSYYNAPYTASLNTGYNKGTSEYTVSANVLNNENSDDSYSFTSSGTLSQTDTTFDLSAQNLNITSGNKNLITLDFDTSITELTSQIEKPSGSEINLFTTNNEELMSLVSEVRSNFQSLLGMAALMGLGG